MKGAVLSIAIIGLLAGCSPKPVAGTPWVYRMAGDQGPPYPHADKMFTFPGGTADTEMQCDNSFGDNGTIVGRMLTLDVILKDLAGKPLKLNSESSERAQIDLIAASGRRKSTWVEIRSPGHFAASFYGNDSDSNIHLPDMIDLRLASGHMERLVLGTSQPSFARFLERCETYAVPGITVTPR